MKNEWKITKKLLTKFAPTSTEVVIHDNMAWAQKSRKQKKHKVHARYKQTPSTTPTAVSIESASD